MFPFNLTILNFSHKSRRTGRGVFPLRMLKIACVLCIAPAAFDKPAVAQSGVQRQSELVREIERLRRDLSDIQRFVYRGDDTVTPPPASSANSSDTGAAARLQRQTLEIQSQIRELTGHIERIQHDVRMIGERLDKLVADVDIRLQALEGGTPPPRGVPQLSASPLRPAPTQQGGPVGTTVISSGGESSTGTELAPGQRSLGRISETELAAIGKGRPFQTGATVPSSRIQRSPAPARPPAPQAAPAPGNVTASISPIVRPLGSGELPEGTPRQQYEFAFGKLKERKYEAAENALRAFVDRHPDNPLAGNAMYWMGETLYVRKQFPEAARIFLDAYQRFPKGNKAPDNLFKLAKSLVQIGETTSACTTYAELVKTFPSANTRILTGTKNEMKRLGCR